MSHEPSPPGAGRDPRDELASLMGVEPGYWDNWGVWRETSPEARDSILRALGVRDVEARLAGLRNLPWSRFIEPSLVVPADRQPLAIPVYFSLEAGAEAGVRISWRVRDESGRRLVRELGGMVPAAEREIDGVRYVRVDLPNYENRPIGYYTVEVLCVTPGRRWSGSMRLIVAPKACHAPEGRTWGLTLNLYALRSKGNWGVGDLSDLEAVMASAGGPLGAGFVGINPLHATPNRMPYGISPYSSTSRLYRNLIYADVEAAPGGKGIARALGLEAGIKRLRGTELIDYEGVAALKDRALRAAYLRFREGRGREFAQEWEEFERYVAEEGLPLADYATFLAIEERLRAGRPDLYRWQDWPSEYSSPRLESVASFREQNPEAVGFHAYVQWVLDRQLKRAGEAGRGMALGIYQDLAVGSSGESADAWCHPAELAFGASAGVPPDAFNLKGQNWGFPPMNPHALRESGYELFVRTIRSSLKYAGALRIDHALGLFRLFFVPEGMEATEGAYVRCPSDDLMGIIALESVRARAVVIAEDLGTIGPDVRRRLQEFGMLSYRLFYFERDWDGDRSFLPPGAYPETAFAAVTTHDLPTLRGYWEGHDIRVKAALNLYPDRNMIDGELWARGEDRDRILQAVCPYLPKGFPPRADDVPGMRPELLLAIHRLLARSPAWMVGASLDDLLSVLEQQNVPGTVDAHPNWRRKVPVPVERFLGREDLTALARMFADEGRGPAGA